MSTALKLGIALAMALSFASGVGVDRALYHPPPATGPRPGIWRSDFKWSSRAPTWQRIRVGVVTCSMGGHEWTARDDGTCWAIDGGLTHSWLQMWK